MFLCLFGFFLVLFVIVFALVRLDLKSTSRKFGGKRGRKSIVKYSIARFYIDRGLYNFVHITKINVKKKVVTIYSICPGVIIGVKASRLIELEEYLGRTFGIEKVLLKESNPFE